MSLVFSRNGFYKKSVLVPIKKKRNQQLEFDEFYTNRKKL